MPSKLAHKKTPRSKRNPANVRHQDPYVARERESYENPIPSREYILEIMAREGVPLSTEQLFALLEIKKNEREIFGRRLAAMERDGQIIRNRKNALCIAEKLHLISGRVEGHADGFGFLIPDKGGEDIYLSAHEMEKVLHGDRVMVRPSGFDRKGRLEGKIVDILERTNKYLVGRIIKSQGLTLVAAEDKRIHQDIIIPPNKEMNAKPDQVVVVELIEQPRPHAKPIGQVTEILGNYADPGMEIEIALRKHQLPYQFSPAAIKQAESYSAIVSPEDMKGRTDLRDMTLITIDGETARDFDDAVYCEPQGKGWRLVVAIADVSFYVKPGDALDKDAYERGNSVYFPRRVIPMLPEALSNGLCSLNPEVDRMCMVCDMQIDHVGEIKRYLFYPAVMRSKARMTYTKVHEILMHPEGDLAQSYAWLKPHLNHLYAYYQLSLKLREKRGAIEFDSQENVMIFNDQGKIDHIEPVIRNEAHRLIEECMLAANVCAADFINVNEHPSLFRVHEGPTPEKLEALRTFMGEFGFSLGGGEHPTAKDYAKLRALIKGRPDEQLLQTVLLRSMQQAVYQSDNLGHFGLAYEAYTHFTSPIRRYPDLLVHRAIKAILQKTQYQPGHWNEIGEHCSMTERRADDATRDVEAWLKCFYMQDKIGEAFTGTVAGVTSFGLFVMIDDLFVEGLLHVTELGNDYFQYNKISHEMVGERTGLRYRLGDRIHIRVSRVDLETSRIDFVLGDQFVAGSPIPEELSILPEKYRKNNASKHTPSANSQKQRVSLDKTRPERDKSNRKIHNNSKNKPVVKGKQQSKKSKG
jgi:ribonuclease R